MKKWINNIVQWCYKFCQRTWIIVLVMCMVGCYSNGENGKSETIYGWKTVEIDGCEYLSATGSGWFIVHKANCKNHTADTVYLPVPSESHSQIK